MSKEVVWSFFSFFVLSVSGGVGSERNIMSKNFDKNFMRVRVKVRVRVRLS